MRPSDLIRLAFSNLKRRKTRTVLTVLGVVIGTASIVVMVALIALYNLLCYELGIISMDNTVIRGVLYGIAMVIAGFCGIMLMHASQKKNKIDGIRQAVGISRETLEAWKKGEYDE